MKKKIVTILSLLVLACLCAVGLVACNGGAKWNPADVTVKDFSKDTLWTDGGFIAETDNCFYYINGIGKSENDNTFGAPIKGSLVAVEKQSLLSGDEVKSCIVVPKLFVASDYNAGLYFFGEYVYYATPNTSKNSEGKIANNELVFARTKLDGTDTTIYTNVTGISTQYRFVKNGEDVVVVYYDDDETSLISYSTTSKTKTVLAKTDAECDISVESLNAYKFNDKVSEGQPVVFYTTTIYSEPYNEEDAKDEDYSRAERAYNKVYGYVAGNDAVCVLDGNKIVAEKYDIKKIINSKVYYSITKNESQATATFYGIKAADLMNNGVATKYFNTGFFDDLSNVIINSDTEVYYLDSDAGFVYKTTLIATDKKDLEAKTAPVASCSTISTLLYTNGDFIYYFNTDGALARIKYQNVDETLDQDKNEQRVSNGSAGLNWFNPVIINWKGTSKTTIFFIDTTDLGNSYVAYVDVNSAVSSEDSDYDGKIDKWFLEGEVIIAIMNNEDKANLFAAKVSDIAEGFDDSSRLVWDTDNDGKVILGEDGLPTVKLIAETREYYNNLKETNKEIYDLISADTVAILEKYEKALEISRALYPLSGFSALSIAEKDSDAWKAKYNTAHAVLENFFNSDTSDAHAYYDEVRDLVVVNLNYEHDTAKKYYSAS